MKKTKEVFLELRESQETEQDTAYRAYLEELKMYEIKLSNNQQEKKNDEQI